MNGELQKYVIDKIADARKKMGLTQKELAEKLGVSQSYYNQIEKGDHQIKLDLIERLGEIFNVPAFMLIYNDEKDDWPFYDAESQRTIEALERVNQLYKNQIDQLQQVIEIQKKHLDILEKLNGANDLLEKNESLWDIVKNLRTQLKELQSENEKLEKITKGSSSLLIKMAADLSRLKKDDLSESQKKLLDEALSLDYYRNQLNLYSDFDNFAIKFKKEFNIDLD